MSDLENSRRSLERATYTPIKVQRPIERAISNRDIADSLKPVFETRVQRTVHRLQRNGSEIEFALDRGEILLIWLFRKRDSKSREYRR
jgi:hypothetical protein